MHLLHVTFTPLTYYCLFLLYNQIDSFVIIGLVTTSNVCCMLTLWCIWAYPMLCYVMMTLLYVCLSLNKWPIEVKGIPIR